MIKSQLFLQTKGNSGLVNIGGLYTRKFSLSNKMLNATNMDSGKWRELLPLAGVSHVSIAGEGVFMASSSQNLITRLAFNNSSAEFVISLNNGDTISGEFYIISYNSYKNLHDEDKFSISLESSGNIKYSSKIR